MTDLPIIPSSVRTHDNTMMSTWDKCERLYDIRHRKGLVSKGRSAALAFGGLMHEGLKVWYETQNPETACQEILDNKEFTDPPDDYRTRGRALTEMIKYIEYYGDERQWFGQDVLLTETGVEVEDPKDGFRWGGRIDLIVVWNGRPWVVDHKTTSMGGSRWWDEYKISNQMGGYVFAANLLHGQPVAGVIVNRLTIQKNEKPAEVAYERRPFLWHDWMIEEWKEQQIKNYHEIAAAEAADHFPPNWYSCVGRYGRCPAYSVCTLPPGSRERSLKQDFEHDPWDWRDEE